MKILFVENRFKTGFWDRIAIELEKEGHLIYWIVQNYLFKPKSGRKYIIPYPKGSYKAEKKYDEDIQKIIISNRGINFNKIKKDDYIFYYNDKITKIINELNPNICFGEATQFHELLVSKECKKRNIPFLHPTSCRYPIGRFSFYKYDTLEPFLGSKERLDNHEATEIINSIINRTSKPDYMVLPKSISFFDKYLSDKTLIMLGYILGEKYATPSPLVKYSQEKQLSRNISRWNEKCLTINEPVANKFKIIYPLHLQPESSIDVWATNYINQLSTIQNIEQRLNDDEVLFVKLNPRPGLEINDELIDFCSSRKKIIMLHSNLKMSNIFDEVDLIFTATGTVGLEAIFSNKPSIVLADMINSEMKNCFRLSNFDDLRNTINLIKLGDFPQVQIEDKIRFINRLNETSYKGVIGDSLYFKNCLDDEENVNSVLSAFKDVINYNAN